MPIDQIAVFTIEELTGLRRFVQLAERGLPYRPYTLKTSQRLNLTWYPGNPIATSTIFGAMEEPTVLDGMWKDKYIQPLDTETGGRNELSPILIDGERPENVREAVDVLDSICRHGQLLEVKWDQQFRRGHLKSFEKRWHNVHDVEWTMSFDWISRDEEPGPAVIVTQASLQDTQSALQRTLNALRLEALPAPFGAYSEFTDAMDQILTTLESDVDALQSIVEDTVRAAVSPIDASRRTVALLTGTIGRAREVKDLVEQEVVGGWRALVSQASGLRTQIRGTDPPEEENIGDLTFTERLEGAAYSRNVGRQSEVMRREAIERRERFLLELENDLLKRVIAREGEDLRDVARRELGDEGEWRRLLFFNELTSSALTGGQLVLIPRRDPGDC